VIGFETQDIERKVLSILKVPSDSQAPLGARHERYGSIPKINKTCGIVT
jgi:hypothetical protein